MHYITLLRLADLQHDFACTDGHNVLLGIPTT